MGSACCVAARPDRASLYNDGPLAAFSENLVSHWDIQSQAEAVAHTSTNVSVQRSLSLNGRDNRVANSCLSNHQQNLSGNISVDSGLLDSPQGPSRLNTNCTFLQRASLNDRDNRVASSSGHQQNISGNISVDSSLTDSFRAPHCSISPHLSDLDGNLVYEASDSTLSPRILESSNEECSASSPLNLHTVGSQPREPNSQCNQPGRFKRQFSSRRASICGQPSSSKHLHHTSNDDIARTFSNIQMHTVDSLNSSPMPESDERPSFKSIGSSHNSLMASHNVSDWWSMQTFSDLIASSRREQLSWCDAASPLDFGWIPGIEIMDGDSLTAERIRANSSEAVSTSHKCGICSQHLPYNSETSSNDLSVVAVLFCGHVYHADCLEKVTSKACEHDPSCPICTGSDVMFSKHISYRAARVVGSKSGFFKALRSRSQSSTRTKMSRIGVSNDDIIVPRISSGEIILSSKDQSSSDNVIKLSSSAIEKYPSNKRLFGRYFSFGGKSRKEHAPSDATLKLPVTLRHSGESSVANDFSLLHAMKGYSRSFKYFQKRAQD